MSSSSPSFVQGSDTSREKTKTPSNNSVVGSINNSGRKGRLKGHNRSLSHNKALNKLSSSSVAFAATRPHLNRSKSTDGLLKTTRSGNLKRNNRSYTKLLGLHPLTKTKSNQSLKSNKSNTSLKGLTPSIINLQVNGLKSSGKKERAILRLNEDDPYHEYEDMDNDYDNEPNNDTLSKQSYKEIHLGEQMNDLNSRGRQKGKIIDYGINGIDDTLEKPIQNRSDYVQYSEEMKQQSTIPVEEKLNKESNDNFNNAESINNKNYDSLTNKSAKYSKQEILNPSISTSGQIEEAKKKDDVSSSSIAVSSNLLKSDASSDEYIESTNLYGGSLLLSQSTGVMKKLDSNAPVVETRQDNLGTHGRNIGAAKIPAIGSATSDGISGISFRAKPIESKAEPITTNKNVATNNSYQPGQTIFSNLQRTNSQYLSYKNSKQNNSVTPKRGKQVQNPQVLIGNGTTNFSDFLNSNNTSQPNHNQPTMENRTQQRLWLQRENSLMDVPTVDPNQIANLSTLSLSNLMFAHNYNQSTQNIRDISNSGIPSSLTSYNDNQIQVQPPNSNEANSSSTSNFNGLLLMVQNNAQNSIQTRTGFERLNREYLNVRRNLNPVAKSIDRIQNVLGNRSIDVTKTRKGSSILSNNQDSNKNTFKEFSPTFHEKEQEINQKLNRQWQEALLSSSSSANTPHAIKYFNSTSDHEQLDQPQNLLNSRILSSNSSLHNFRSSQAPTTRAVKLAAQNGNI